MESLRNTKVDWLAGRIIVKIPQKQQRQGREGYERYRKSRAHKKRKEKERAGD